MQSRSDASPPQDSLITGKLTGNLENFIRLWQIPFRITKGIQMLAVEFPRRQNRERFASDEGTTGVEQGIGVSVHFSHTCSAADEHDLFSPSMCRWRDRNDER